MSEHFSVAIAHDYLTQRGGAERVALAMHQAFPQAPIFTTLYDPEGTFPEFKDADIRVTALNRGPSATITASPCHYWPRRRRKLRSMQV